MQIHALPQRYWDKVDKSGTCWIWIGARNDHGYGVIGAKQITGKPYEYAHRLMFWHHGGILKENEVVDHNCGQGSKGCVTPSHLRALDRNINNGQGGWKTRKLVCDKCGGHRKQKASKKEYFCPSCERDYQRKYNAKNRTQINARRRKRRAGRKNEI